MTALKFPTLAQPVKIGSLMLKNRVGMSSLTRNRADPGGIPNDRMVQYYTDRASAGILLSEGIYIEPQGGEWSFAPGIWNDKQVAGWRKVTDSVRAAGGVIFAQLWHVGRVAHPLLQDGKPAVAPSAVAAKGGLFRQLEGRPGYVTPEAIEDPAVYVEMFRKASENARKAGFDGVELHAANGYLPGQFLESHSNLRTDAYGGTPQKRAKFILDTLRALISTWDNDASRVGIKLSPSGGYNDMGDPYDVMLAEYTAVLDGIDSLGLGYVQLMRYMAAMDPTKRGTEIDVLKLFGKKAGRKVPVIVNSGLTPEEAEKIIGDGDADIALFGRATLANPNFAKMIQDGRELAQLPYTQYYADDAEGRGYIKF
ncbi:hypothetical protein HK101_002427 [Irineochytrium annulatum]|nr:hypothetical protein HK101_002427 [Irineochytrium annulatum]